MLATLFNVGKLIVSSYVALSIDQLIAGCFKFQDVLCAVDEGLCVQNVLQSVVY